MFNKKTKPKMQENLYTPDCIRTISGRYVNILAPTPDMIDIQDIAHGLARQYRFGGHTKTPYNVLRHSLQVCWRVSIHNRLAALLHDAAEAYLGDIPSPLKAHLPEYKIIEDRLMGVIAQKFGFKYPLLKEIKDADKKELEKEWQNFVINDFTCIWSEDTCIDLFIAKFEFLTNNQYTNNQYTSTPPVTNNQ